MKHIECCSMYQPAKRYIYQDGEIAFLRECAICGRSILFKNNELIKGRKAKSEYEQIKKAGLLKKVKEIPDGSLNKWIYGKKQIPYYFDTNKRAKAGDRLKCS